MNILYSISLLFFSFHAPCVDEALTTSELPAALRQVGGLGDELVSPTRAAAVRGKLLAPPTTGMLAQFETASLSTGSELTLGAIAGGASIGVQGVEAGINVIADGTFFVPEGITPAQSIFMARSHVFSSEIQISGNVRRVDAVVLPGQFELQLSSR